MFIFCPPRGKYDTKGVPQHIIRLAFSDSRQNRPLGNATTQQEEMDKIQMYMRISAGQVPLNIFGRAAGCALQDCEDRCQAAAVASV